MRKKLPWFEIALAVVILSAYSYAALSDAYNLPNRWFIRDDAYYYFKVAQNISEGHGSTFDGIHPTNGYHPLWMLVCVPIFALARFDLILPLRALVIATGLLQVGTTILLYRLVRTTISLPVAVLAASYWAFDSYILVFLYKTGVESSIALFFILLLLTLARRFETSWRQIRPSASQIAMLGIAATLVVFSRLDLIFFAVIFGVWIVLRGSPMRYLLPLDILAIVVSGLGAFLARVGVTGYYGVAQPGVIMLVLAVAIQVPILYMCGAYARYPQSALLSAMLRTTIAVALGSALVSAAMLAGRALNVIPAFPRPALLYEGVFTLAILLVIRLIAGLSGTGPQVAENRSPLGELSSSWKSWWREGAVYYGILGGSLGIYMLWNKLAFGSFSPVSGQIKRWWGTFQTSVYGGPPQSVAGFFGLDARGAFNDWSPATSFVANWSSRLLYGPHPRFDTAAWDRNFLIVLGVSFAVLIAIFLWRRQQANPAILQTSLIPLFVGSWLQILSYNATGYASPKEWYWLTEPLLSVLVGAWLLNLLNEFVLSRWIATRALMWTAIGVVVLGGVVSYWRDAIALYPYGQAPAGVAYADVVPFLESHTKPGAIIGMTGGGNVGYFLHDRTIVNMDGLINSPEYFTDLKLGTSPDYLYRSGMRYVFANPSILEADPYRGQYTRRLEPLVSWGGKDLMRLLPDPGE